jgi:hypothetical protein
LCPLSRGASLPGSTLADSTEIFGDDLERVVTWKDGSDLSGLAGKPVRRRFAPRRILAGRGPEAHCSSPCDPRHCLGAA